MSTAELIEVIKALPPEKQKQVESFVHNLQNAKPVSYANDDAVKLAADKIFRENDELFRKLAS